MAIWGFEHLEVLAVDRAVHPNSKSGIGALGVLRVAVACLRD